MEPKVGLIFEETHHKWPNRKYTYKILKTDLVGDSFGTIQLSILKVKEPYCEEVTYEIGERLSVVEELWFDEEWTKRKFKILNDEN